MLNTKHITDLVKGYSETVSSGRTIEQIIADGDLPRLESAVIQKGKVSDSVYGPNLITKDGLPIRLMYRTTRVSTHDKNRGTIPFKDQVLALNHNFMLQLVKTILGTSQFEVPGLDPTSTVIASENIETIMFENVLRMYMAKTNTSTSLYVNWQKAIENNQKEFEFAGHKFATDKLSPNCKLDYLVDTPSTKEKVDRTVNPKELIDMNICSCPEYVQIRDSSMMGFGIVTNHLNSRGIVLGDTKTEHGRNRQGLIVSQDELYTMDSSRYWRMNDKGILILDDKGDPESVSKQFVRDMKFDENGLLSIEDASRAAIRYIEGYQYITGIEFKPDLRSRDERIIDSTNQILDYLL